MKKIYPKNAIFCITKIFNLFLCFCLFFFVQTSFGQTQTFTTSGSFTVPCDVSSITVKVWGGGGAGGGSNNSGSSGEGGGAGGYSYGVVSVTAGQTINYTVGNGGLGGTGNGENGGNSSFLTLNGFGGNGGDRNGNVTTGIGGLASGGSLINTQGGNGGAGGSSTGGNGGNAANGGTGGLGVNNGNGGIGNIPGGGGGGGEKTGVSNNSGGNGGRGQIELTYTSLLMTYCTPSYNNVEPITNVTFAGINNTSTDALGGSSLEVFCSLTASVIQGSPTNAISVKGNTDGNFTEYIKAYVDWDQNGVFGNSPNEIFDLGTITNSTGIDAVFAGGNIAVPSTAIIGSTMMRVVKTYFSNGVNSNNPCFSGADWGQAEDYTVDVLSPLPVITSLGSTGACVGAIITINGINLLGATLVRIGGTTVSSITSNTATQIVAVVGAGTTGTVTVTTSSGTSLPSSATFNVYPTTSISAQSTATQSQCLGSAFMPITVTAGGSGLTYQWYSNASNSNLGGTSLGTANGAQTNSYTPQSTVAGTLYYYCIVTGTCGIATSAVSGAFITNASPTVPTVGIPTQPTCVVPTGSVALSGLPAGTWTINASPNTPGLTGLTGSTADTIIGGLAQGTSYTFTVSDVTCTSMPTAPVVVGTVETITSSDGVTWTSAPTISKIGTITAPSAVPVTITSDTELCSCTISLNTNVEVASGVTLKLQDKLTVNGSLTFKNNASLVQDNDVVNTGNITYERKTVTDVDKFDFTYWSSPVFPQTLLNVSPNTLGDKYFSFDAVADDWITETPSTKVMDRGVGYIIRGPQDFSVPSIYTANFIGVPNNGTIQVDILATGEASYLLGNPYPSALDADTFLGDNDLVIDGTLYFWTHNTDITPSGSQYVYDSDDYASYNILGGVGTAPAASDVSPIPKIPTGEIASGQGFFATSIAPGTVNFTNTMRLGGNVNTQFFRSNSKSKKNASIDKSRLWLNFSNTEGAFKQTLIGYATGATNEYERKFDGISFDGNTFVDFYSVLQDKNFVIQGRALPFLQSDLVPLGYNTTIAGTFTITIFQTDGFLTTQDVFLEDKMRGVIHNLKESPYSFATEKGVFNERFVLRYTDKTLGTGGFESEDKTIVVFKEKNELKIKSEFETMKRVTVFDLLGKKVFDETLKDVNEFRTSKITLKNQIVIVKVVLTNGHVVTKKVSY